MHGDHTTPRLHHNLGKGNNILGMQYITINLRSQNDQSEKFFPYYYSRHASYIILHDVYNMHINKRKKKQVYQGVRLFRLVLTFLCYFSDYLYYIPCYYTLYPAIRILPKMLPLIYS